MADAAKLPPILLPILPPILPPILEIKRTLDGREKRFSCRRLAGDADHQRAVLLFVHDQAMHVHGVDLAPGTITFGYFWADRPYNAYHWLDAMGATIGVYFNLADETRITDDVLEWRDLTVDVLTTAAGRVDVLDEDELPAELDPALRAHIDAGKAAILDHVTAVLAEIERESQALRPLVFAGERRS
jgi:hypothetical protein